MAHIDNIFLKKQYGQHFLRNRMIVDHMLDAVTLTKHSSVFEIGPGDGFLTRAILECAIARLWCFEIDPEWARYIANAYDDPRLQIFEQNFLDVDFSIFDSFKPWILLANLPYQITFPILHLLVKHIDLLQEGVIMTQEEVAQKIVAKRGRGYGFISLYFQYYFDWKLLDKVLPTSFYPPPKVYSRLLYFKPRRLRIVIEYEEQFWRFIKRCFAQPRRTLKNNLVQSNFDVNVLPENLLSLRAQQLGFEDLLSMWKIIISKM